MTSGRGVWRRVWRAGCVAGAVALLFQIVSWAWMPAWTSVGSPDAERIVICTPDGLKTIALDDHGTPSDPDAGTTGKAVAGGFCPLCPLVGGLAMPPVTTLAVARDFERHGPEALPGSHIAAGWFLSSLQARAPPTIG